MAPQSAAADAVFLARPNVKPPATLISTKVICKVKKLTMIIIIFV